MVGLVQVNPTCTFCMLHTQLPPRVQDMFENEQKSHAGRKAERQEEMGWQVSSQVLHIDWEQGLKAGDIEGTG